MLEKLLKFYNITMILATIVAITGGVLKSEQMLSAAMAMTTAAGTSFQVQQKVLKGENSEDFDEI